MGLHLTGADLRVGIDDATVLGAWDNLVAKFESQCDGLLSVD